MSAYSGLFRRVPAYALVVAVLAVGSFGLPGMSGFVAEFQVVAAALAASPWIAAVALISIVLTTGLYLLVISRMLLGAATSELPGLERPPLRRLVSVGVLALSSIGLGILPGPLIAWIAATGRALSTGGG